MLKPAPLRHAAFTLIELLVVISIIALLISILLPSLAAARKSARTIQCLSSQKQIGLTVQLYADDNTGYVVPAERPNPFAASPAQATFHVLLNPYIAGANETRWEIYLNRDTNLFWSCPEWEAIPDTDTRPGYGVNVFLNAPDQFWGAVNWDVFWASTAYTRLDDMPAAGKHVLLGDAVDFHLSNNGNPTMPNTGTIDVLRHNDGAGAVNFLFGDLHAGTLTGDDAIDQVMDPRS